MKYLIHADGKLPNLALMRLGSYFRSRGEAVQLVRGAQPRSLWDGPGEVYGSSIFKFSAPARAKIEREWGEVRWGGTGVRLESSLEEVDRSVDWESVAPDYSLYPSYRFSVGFTQRGCRLKCGFCVVPKKEGGPRSVGTIASIWRGDPHPRKVVLLDNDFFGQPKERWSERVKELRDGRFHVCLSQGINIRMVDEESAAALASVEYRDNEFGERVLYTAWDNLGDERLFKRGVELLRAAGVPPKHLRVYMLVGYAKDETMERVLYRFNELVALGCDPYPMVYEDLGPRPELRAFQRWAVMHLYKSVPWDRYLDRRLGNGSGKGLHIRDQDASPPTRVLEL